MTVKHYKNESNANSLILFSRSSSDKSVCQSFAYKLALSVWIGCKTGLINVDCLISHILAGFSNKCLEFWRQPGLGNRNLRSLIEEITLLTDLNLSHNTERESDMSQRDFCMPVCSLDVIVGI